MSAAWIWKLNDPGDELTIYCLVLCLERAGSCWPLPAPTGAPAVLVSSALNLRGEITNRLSGMHYSSPIQRPRGNFTFSFHFQNVLLLIWIKYEVFPSTAWSGIWWTFPCVFVIRTQPFYTVCRCHQRQNPPLPHRSWKTPCACVPCLFRSHHGVWGRETLKSLFSSKGVSQRYRKSRDSSGACYWWAPSVALKLGWSDTPSINTYRAAASLNIPLVFPHLTDILLSSFPLV